MGRIFGILLMVVAIWYGVEQLGAGMGDDTPAAAPEQARTDASRRDPADSDRPAPVTRRVHDRVTAAMEEGARRHSGGR